MNNGKIKRVEKELAKFELLRKNLNFLFCQKLADENVLGQLLKLIF